MMIRQLRGEWVLPSASLALEQSGEWSDLLPPEQETSLGWEPSEPCGSCRALDDGGWGWGEGGEDCRQIINGHALTQLNPACFCWQASAIMHLITGGRPNASWEETRTPN